MSGTIAKVIPEPGRSCFSRVIPVYPYCGETHRHGSGALDGAPHDCLGWNVSHCLGLPADRNDYGVVDATTHETADPLRRARIYRRRNFRKRG